MQYSVIFKFLKNLLLVDVLFCTVLIPISGVFLSGICAKEFDLSLEWELVLSVLLSYLFACIILFAHSRTRWKPQFLTERSYYYLLQVRDILNAVIALFSLGYLATTTQEIVEDGEIKTPAVGEGVVYFSVKFVLGQLNVNIDLPKSAKDFGLNCPQSEDPRQILQFEHGGEFMFWWAVVATCVAKLVYFNSAFTIIRASEIFLDLNPAFNNEDEKDVPVQEQTCQKQEVQELKDDWDSELSYDSSSMSKEA